MASSALSSSYAPSETAPLRCSYNGCPTPQALIQKVDRCSHCIQFAYCSNACSLADNLRHRNLCPIYTKNRLVSAESALRAINRYNAQQFQTENRTVSASIQRVAECLSSRTQQEALSTAQPCLLELAQHRQTAACRKELVVRELDILGSLVEETNYLLLFPEIKEWAVNKKQQLLEWIAINKKESAKYDVVIEFLGCTSAQIGHKALGLAPPVRWVSSWDDASKK